MVIVNIIMVKLYAWLLGTSISETLVAFSKAQAPVQRPSRVESISQEQVA